MKIFHSMALRGRSPEQIEKDRAQHYEWIKNLFKDAEILDTYITTNPPEDVKEKSLWYFGKGLVDYLSKADILVVPHNWYDIRGVKCEKYIAEQYGVPVIVMPDFTYLESLK